MGSNIIVAMISLLGTLGGSLIRVLTAFGKQTQRIQMITGLKVV